jgi:hypothetical protein
MGITSIPTAAVAAAAALMADVYCPDCGLELEPWEVHLLKRPQCRGCGAELQLGAALPISLQLETVS